MSTFVFKAMDLTGAKATGEVDADTKQVVSDQLKARGLIVLEIAEKGGSKELRLPFGNRVKTNDLTILTRQLATMISSGMTILRALYVLEAQTENKLLADVIAEGIWCVLPSRIRLRTAGVGTRTSQATTRPAPSVVGSSCWVMMPMSATESCTRTWSC